MHTINIWFNRWFSVAYHYMNMLRDNPDGRPVRLFGTHPDLEHMSLQACDVKEAEPEVTGEAYIEFCLDFCRRHHIHVFIPRLHLLDIARHAERFAAIGTSVMACRNIDLLERMMHKDQFYELAQRTGAVPVPDYEIVRDAAGFKAAYTKLQEKGHRVCIKPTLAEGGKGFRVIVDHKQPLTELYDWVNHRMTLDEAMQTLSSAEQFEPLMVMELLPGDEVSIDCVATAEGELLTAIPRRKLPGRVYLLEDKDELLAIASQVAASCRIPYAYNIQVKYNQATAKLLEINPRLSGGAYLSCLSGVNLPYLAVQAVLGHEVAKPSPELGIRVSYVEQPVRLRNV
ncbi:ATP-grasp domain-containing protein [Paenibacillus sp. SYP-B4298]|uniref:ATP-grasp domain-containing protein n=1 Tax=Paenibacillus sp. SYP-B4298 TaxID=2996034 RepID=UPI0022DDB3A0|nr:ATP-grasp domain-containing protein [Paenibacillus sp. SYP-B4298]